MIVGATGVGKTTLSTGMITYLFGVRWEDTFRFTIVVENAGTQAESVTQKITAYTIYYQEGSLRNFSLTLVDTPGVGDTKGLKGIRRQEGTSKISFPCPHLKVELIIVMP